MAVQLSHEESSHYRHPFHIILVADGVSSPANIGGLFRICDAFGVSKLIVSEAEIDLKSARLRRNARNCEKTVASEEVPNTHDYLRSLKLEGYVLVGLEITSKSIPIQQLELNEEKKYAIVVGNEQFGISEKTIAHFDYVAHIEMFGENSSMNVTQATSIALFEWTKNKSSAQRK